MLRRQKHALSESTTPFACTLASWSHTWKGRHANPDTLAFLARKPRHASGSPIPLGANVTRHFFDTRAFFLKRTDTLSTIA